MFSIADMAVAGAVALLLFGPDQLPKVARRAGQLVRDVQNTSQSFIREMERAADAHDSPIDAAPPYAAPVFPGAPETPAAPLYHEAPEPASHDLVVREAALGPHPGDGIISESTPHDPGTSIGKAHDADAAARREDSAAMRHADGGDPPFDARGGTTAEGQPSGAVTDAARPGHDIA